MYASDIDFIEVEDKEEEDEAEEEEEAPIAVAPSVGVSVCCCCLRLPPFLEPSLLISVLWRKELGKESDEEIAVDTRLFVLKRSSKRLRWFGVSDDIGFRKKRSRTKLNYISKIESLRTE